MTVQLFPPAKDCVDCLSFGPVAQLVAHLHGMQGVRGSSPLRSTKELPRSGGVFRYLDNLFGRAFATRDCDSRLGNVEVISQHADQRSIGLTFFRSGSQRNG